jgi:hypothetical protein
MCITINPASNAGQQSYLRITDPSSAEARANIVAVCDDGISKPAIGFAIGAGKSVLVTSSDLENGNAAKGVATGVGACSTGGKSRLSIIGEVIGMHVQNFLRNTTSGGLINTNINYES